MLYAEWVRLVTGGEPGSGRVRQPCRRRVPRRRRRAGRPPRGPTRQLTTGRRPPRVPRRTTLLLHVRPVAARRGLRPRPRLPDGRLRHGGCAGRPGCDAASIAEPAQNVLYELRTERPIRSITEPTGSRALGPQPVLPPPLPQPAGRGHDARADDPLRRRRHRPHDDEVPGADRGAAPSGATTTAP